MCGGLAVMSELAPIHRLVLDAALAIVALPILDWLETKRSRIFHEGQRHRESVKLTPARYHRHTATERRTA